MKYPRTAAIVVSVFAVALILSLGGCAVNGGAGEYRDPSVPIVVEKGEEFAIMLESNPSDGFRWQLGRELDEKIVTLEKVEFHEPDPEMAGRPGEEKWTFKASGLGRTEIELRYVRPWEEAPGSGAVMEKPAPGEAEKAESGEVREEAGEAGPQALVFSVWVKKKGAVGKEPKKYEDPAETIEVEEGYRFSVVLESDPTAGYQWELAEPPDRNTLSLASVTFEAKGGSAEGKGTGGAPGEEVWTFEALHPGEAELIFAYRRPWEREAAPEESKTFKVEVKAVEEEASSGH